MHRPLGACTRPFAGARDGSCLPTPRGRPACAPGRRTARPPPAPAARRANERVARAACRSHAGGSPSRLSSDHRRPESAGGARRREQVRGEPLRRVRDASAPRDAAHVHDVRLPVALDDVDAVEIDAEGPAAALRDVAQLLRRREWLPVFLVLGPRRKDLLDTEQPAADRVDLPVPALGRVVALGEDRLPADRYSREVGDTAHDPDSDAFRALIRLDDDWAFVEERRALPAAPSRAGRERRPARRRTAACRGETHAPNRSPGRPRSRTWRRWSGTPSRNRPAAGTPRCSCPASAPARRTSRSECRGWRTTVRTAR